MGTAGEWEEERETWEEGLTKSLQQVQSPDCISEGSRGYTREHWAAALSLPVARRQEGRLEAGIGSVRQNGLVPDPDETVEKERRAGILLILPCLCLWQTSLIKLKVSGRHY